MKHCQRCNLDLPDAFKFCASCGGNLTEASPAMNGLLSCPNCGELVEPAWKFCTTCQTKLPSPTLSQQDPPPPSSIPDSAAPPISVTARVPVQGDGTAQLATAGSQIFVRCRTCKELVEEDASFCDHCGADMIEDTAPLPFSLVHPPQTFRDEQTFSDDTFSQGAGLNGGRIGSTKSTPYGLETVPAPLEDRVKKTAPTLTMLESYGRSGPAAQWKHGAIVVALLLMVLAGLAVGGWFWWSHRRSVAQSSPQPSSGPPSPAASSSASSASTVASATAPEQSTINGSADEELKRLRERRTSSEGSEMIAAIEEAENKYPTDYRFPYERAKLFGKGIISHHEAFEAVFLAAEKAIDNGKAQEMLNDLMSDKDGDFSRLSRGHHEWTLLEEALRDRDKSAVKTGHH